MQKNRARASHIGTYLQRVRVRDRVRVRVRVGVRGRGRVRHAGTYLQRVRVTVGVRVGVRVAVRVGVTVRVILGLGLEEVILFDSKSENRDRAVEAVEPLSEARVV